MRRDKWLTCPLSAVLSVLLSFAGVMCLQSAFGLTANIKHVLLGCAISAAVFSVGFTVKWWYVPVLMAAPVAGYLWYSGKLPGSLEWLVYYLSCSYDRAYGTGVLYWSSQPPTAGDGTVALCAMGCVIAFVAAWTVCRRKPAVFAVILAALPLAACFVVTDRVPGTGYLYLLLLGMLVLLLSNLTRRKDLKKGNLLTVLVTVPVAICLLVLFWAVPQSTYQGQDRADKILQTVQQWVQTTGEQVGIGGSGLDQTVELDTVGRLVQTHTPVMTVQVEQGGTLYLRQQGFQMYDGTSWYNEHGNDIYAWTHWDQLQQNGVVEITTRTQHLMKFVPYYAQEQIHHPEGNFSSQKVAVNALGITENVQQEYGYTFYLYQIKPDAPSAVEYQTEAGIYLPIGTYTPDAISLPAATVEWAEPLALSLTEGKGTVKEKAEAIGDYVRNLADYSRNTGRMPAGETDFAQWFVTEAETGYCVHFATTAAVLLRAAGIQAQYVEGYTVRLQDGQTVTVYEDQAHAWVEYYDPAVGWRILESTPAEGVPTYTYTPQTGTQNTTQEQQTPAQPQPEQEQPAPEQETKPVWTALYWVLGVLGAVLVILCQWQVRLRLKARRLNKGNANQRAVQLWREIVRLSRLLKQRPAQELHTLAQKAKFSQHVLTGAELEQLTEALDSCRKRLLQKPWYLQPIYTILFAVY